MNRINNRTATQFLSQIARVIEFRDRKFTYRRTKQLLEHTVSFLFEAPKRCKEADADTLSIEVHYNRANDLYDCKVEFIDVRTCEADSVCELTDMYNDQFADFPTFINHYDPKHGE